MSPAVSGPTATSVPASLRHRAAAWAGSHLGLVVLLAAPAVVVVVPRLFGLAYLSGDNMYQNFPMRVLTGQSIAHGNLPLWNTYLFSGTPLLGGFNAGAAYPLTWLMALPDVFTAWALTLVAAFDVAVVGMYLFLRRLPVSSTAATFGAATYAYGGFLISQLVHIDLIEASVWLPFMLLAVQGMTEPPEPPEGARGGAPAAPADAAPATTRPVRRPLHHWAALLALACGLCILSGGVEAILDSVELAVLFACGRLVSAGWLSPARWRRTVLVVASFVGGLAGAAVIGAAQWLPGLTFATQSQRAVPTYAFFTSGSLNQRLLTLVVSPFLVGTNQGWPAPYSGTYNYPEVTSYVGILALIAACSLFLRRWRTRPEARHWWIWYVVGLVGVFAALGHGTPFGHVLYAIPGIDRQRLLNRNLLLLDTSLVVLLSWWVHVLLDRRPATSPAATAPVATAPAAGPDDRRPDDRRPDDRRLWRPGHRAGVIVPALPFALIALLCVLLWLDGSWLQHLLTVTVPVHTSIRLREAGLVTAGAVVAGWATWIVVTAGRRSPVALRRWLAAVVAVDLVLFDAFTVNLPVTEQTAQAVGPASTAFQSFTGNGRFIIYDPRRVAVSDLTSIGQTDLNLFRHLPSAQGYTALTDGGYYRATGAHLQATLDPTTLSGSVWDTLNVTALATPASSFLRPVKGSGEGPTVPAGEAVPFPSGAAAPVGRTTVGRTTVDVGAGTSHTWYFGRELTVRQVTVPVSLGAAPWVRLGLAGTGGSVHWLARAAVRSTGSVAAPTVTADLPAGSRAAGLVVAVRPSLPASVEQLAPGAVSRPSATSRTPAGPSVAVGIPVLRAPEAGEVALDGSLQGQVVPPHWTFAGTIGAFGIFHNPQAAGWASLRTPAGGPAPSPSSLVTAAPDGNGGQTVSVHATTALVLLRSEAWSPGWRATVQRVVVVQGKDRAEPGRTVAVAKEGIVQAVDLPGPGQYLVTFTYAEPSAYVGVVLSAAGAVVLAALAVVEWERLRRRRRREVGRTP